MTVINGAVTGQENGFLFHSYDIFEQGRNQGFPKGGGGTLCQTECTHQIVLQWRAEGSWAPQEPPPSLATPLLKGPMITRHEHYFAFAFPVYFERDLTQNRLILDTRLISKEISKFMKIFLGVISFMDESYKNGTINLLHRSSFR